MWCHWFILDLVCGSTGKETACYVEDLGLIPGLGRYPGEGKGYPLQYSYLENSMDRGAWRAGVHGLQRVGHDWVTDTSFCKCIFKLVSLKSRVKKKLENREYRKSSTMILILEATADNRLTRLIINSFRKLFWALTVPREQVHPVQSSSLLPRDTPATPTHHCCLIPSCFITT